MQQCLHKNSFYKFGKIIHIPVNYLEFLFGLVFFLKKLIKNVSKIQSKLQNLSKETRRESSMTFGLDSGFVDYDVKVKYK